MPVVVVVVERLLLLLHAGCSQRNSQLAVDNTEHNRLDSQFQMGTVDSKRHKLDHWHRLHDIVAKQLDPCKCKVKLKNCIRRSIKYHAFLPSLVFCVILLARQCDETVRWKEKSKKEERGSLKIRASE